VVPKVQKIAEGAALMTGASLEVVPIYPLYENFRPNNVLAKLVFENAITVDLHVDESGAGAREANASTDMGNVSHVIPCSNLSFAISKRPVAGHSTELAEAARSDFALNVAIDAAKTLALTACDLLGNAELVAAARKEFEERGRILNKAL